MRDPDPAGGAAAVDQLGEGSGAAARRGQVRTGGDRAALAPAAAKVDRDERQAGRPGQCDRRWGERPGHPCQRPTVGGGQRVVAAIEPVILVFMGLVIATLLYAFYLPLFQLTSVGQQ